jgi:hypothetical protein
MTLQCLNYGDSENTWKRWQRKAQFRYPLRYLIQESLPSFFKYTVAKNLKNLYWSIRYKTTNRYHILNIGSKENGWTHGYIDVRERILHASFALLVEFAETESDSVCWHWNEDVLRVKAEMDLLYNWWKYERPNRNWTAAEYGKFTKEDSDNLIRLMNIREYLWT